MKMIIMVIQKETKCHVMASTQKALHLILSPKNPGFQRGFAGKKTFKLMSLPRHHITLLQECLRRRHVSKPYQHSHLGLPHQCSGTLHELTRWLFKSPTGKMIGWLGTQQHIIKKAFVGNDNSKSKSKII